MAEKIARASFVVAISSFGRSQLFRAAEFSHWPKVKVVHCGMDTLFTAVAPRIAGWLVPAGSEEALCDAIKDCLTSSETRIIEMGEKGRAQALGRHNIDNEAAKLEELFYRSLKC